MKKLFALIAALALLLFACGHTDTPPEETIAIIITTTENITLTTDAKTTVNYEQPQIKLFYAAGPWQNAYAGFLSEPANYAEDEPHHAWGFAPVDINNDGIPELVLAYGNGIEGGNIFANIYHLRDGNVSIIGRQINMYYKTLHPSTDPSLPGVFVDGGRNSTFQCNYWTIENNVLRETPVWSEAPDFDNDNRMFFKELTDNKQMIAQSKEAVSSAPYGIEFFAIDEDNIQLILNAD